MGESFTEFPCDIALISLSGKCYVCRSFLKFDFVDDVVAESGGDKLDFVARLP